MRCPDRMSWRCFGVGESVLTAPMLRLQRRHRLPAAVRPASPDGHPPPHSGCPRSSPVDQGGFRSIWPYWAPITRVCRAASTTSGILVSSWVDPQDAALELWSRLVEPLVRQRATPRPPSPGDRQIARRCRRVACDTGHADAASGAGLCDELVVRPPSLVVR